MQFKKKQKKKEKNESLFSISNLLILLVLLFAILINRFWLLPHIDTHVYRGVPNFYTWITLWNCHVLGTLDFSNYWSSNAMYPYPHAFAFSENMMGMTPFSAPIWYITKNPILTANLLSILLVWLSAVMTYLIIKKMLNSRLPAVVAALIFSLNPLIMKAFSLGRFHMLGVMWIPLIMYYNWKFWESNSKRYLWLMGFFWIWTFWINIYLGIFLGIFLGIWNLIWFFYQKPIFSLKKIIQWILCVFIIWILMVPIFLVYQQTAQDSGMIRTLENQIQYTGPVWSWFTISDENWLWGKTLKFLPTGTPDGIVEYYMFPGFITMGFFIFSFFIKGMPHWLKSLRITGLVLFFLSMGPYTLGIPWKIPLPFALLWHLYPPLRATRNPHRLSLFVILIIAVLASYIIKKYFYRKNIKIFLVILLCLGICLETMTVVKPKRALNKNAKIFYSILKKDNQQHTIIELPVNIHTDIRAMVSSTFHWNRIINGVSGLWPPLQSQLEWETREFPSTHTIRLLQSLEVDRIIIHEKYYGKKRRRLLRRLKQYPDLKFLYRSGFTSLWFLERGKLRKNFNSQQDLKITAPSFCISGRVNLSLNIEPALENFVFNLKAPSKFRFTPSRLWQIEIKTEGFTKKSTIKESWCPPALFHNQNRRKKIVVDLNPGHNELIVEVDIMGEKVQIRKKIVVVNDQDIGDDFPYYLKLPPGFKKRPWENLKVYFNADFINQATIKRGDNLNGVIEVENPGPFYWTSGQDDGIFLGAKLVFDGKTRIFEFDLPHDLFPNDKVSRFISIPFPERYKKAELYLNCFGKGTKNQRRWFPEDNFIKVWDSQKVFNQQIDKTRYGKN